MRPTNKHERRMIGRKKARRRKSFHNAVDERYLRNTTKTCSGPCCGNMRRWAKGKDKLTMQERKQIMRDAVVTSVEGGVAFEAKAMPDSIPCDVCGEEMAFVSIELGYSCPNPDCELHYGNSPELAEDVEEFDAEGVTKGY